ncbi:unnamed protein product [Echinostoma caproni]|uniref:E3 ubiquitin-protein ligase n=1 Tax=Echinostoma caproni TaxID=27848 RepID=A0A183BFK8_9TREM|nr:unnamed protein product [Echinostoma caproni]
MDFFDLLDAELKDPEEFINHVCHKCGISKEDFRSKYSEACICGNSHSNIFTTVMDIFSYDCFTADRYRMKKARMTFLTKFFEYLIAGDIGIEAMGRKRECCLILLICLVKEYDYSARCSLVWTTNYFAYRCRTCGISSSMSLCSSCFTAGNHVGHDFNKFKSLAGGACDCGDSSVMKESG